MEIPPKNSLVYLSLGSNIGEKIYYINQAISMINKIDGTNITAISSIYNTPPIGYTEQDFFLNCAVEIMTTLTPIQLLHQIQSIEKTLGRERTIKWGPRSIDIDIIFFDQLIINEPDIQIPHPHLQDRAFVMLPLNDINSEFLHPYYKKTVRELLSQLPTEELRYINILDTHLVIDS